MCVFTSPRLRAMTFIDDGSDYRRARVHITLLPQEQILWSFTEPLARRHPSWVLERKRLFRSPKTVSVCTWAGVHCDENQVVISIEWNPSTVPLCGKLNWGALPLTLRRLRMNSHRALTGNVSLTTLPPELNTLESQQNNYHGTLELSSLPNALKNLFLSSNRFEGEIDLTHLPQSLLTLVLSKNRFSGPLCLTELPNAMNMLVLNNNMFVGSVDFSKLPQNMNRIDLSRNQLSGTISMHGVPPDIYEFFVDHNFFTGVVDLSPLGFAKQEESVLIFGGVTMKPEWSYIWTYGKLNFSYNSLHALLPPRDEWVGVRFGGQDPASTPNGLSW